MKEAGQDAMSKIWCASLAQRLALIAVIAVALPGIYAASQPTTALAAGARAPSMGSCSTYAVRHLATNFWHDPVSGTALTANLFGYYEGRRFCGALYAEADLTLPAGYAAEWVCADLLLGGAAACGEPGPGPVTGQQIFFIDSADQLENCDGVKVSIRGFFIADVSTRIICG